VRVLIIRACAIGDFVLNLPALRALAATHPDANFTLVGHPEMLSLASTFMPVDAIHSIEVRPWSRLFYEPLPGLAFDRAWVWMKDPSVARNLRASGIPDVVHAAPFTSSEHASNHLLATVGLSAPELPDLWKVGSDRLLLHPGSGSNLKVWPHFEALASRFPGAEVLLGPADRPLAVSNRRLENLPLAQVADCLRECGAFVGNDSGITHLAAYFGVPVVALFGPTDPAIWGPIGRRVTLLRKPVLADISVDQVVAELRACDRKNRLRTDTMLDCESAG
jgi:ADP-heptose:LPS heptosyltransferase